MIESEDAELVRRSLKGDKEAFGILVDRYQKAVFNAAFRTVGSREDAADLTQVVFLKAFEKLSSYKSTYKFFSWLYRIAVNESINFLKARKQREDIDDSLPAEESGGEGRSPEEIDELVGAALQELTIEYRTVIVLCHLQELSYKEASDILDLPESTLKSRLFTARKLLKDILIRKGILDG